MAMLWEHKAELMVLTASANEREMLPLTATAAIGLGALATGPCPGCGGGLWWRVQVRSGAKRLALPPLRAAEPRLHGSMGMPLGPRARRAECDVYRQRIAATAPYTCNKRETLYGMERLDAADVIVALNRELRCSEAMNGIATRCSHP
jgi:hypothetical protein